jgi:hypothetical protein
MTRPLIQIDDEIREMNDEELAAHEEAVASKEAKEAELAARAEAKAQLLERLGITAEEASLLLA